MNIEVGDTVEFIGWEGPVYEVLEIKDGVLTKLKDKYQDYVGAWGFSQVRLIGNPKVSLIETLKEYEGMFE